MSKMRMISKGIGHVLPFFCAGFLAACGTEGGGTERGSIADADKIEVIEAGIEDGKGGADPGGDIFEADIPENEILLVFRATNGAEGYGDNGRFIDTNGDAYGFDFSQYGGYWGYSNSGMEFYDKLMLIRENTEPKVNVGDDVVRYIYKLGEQIDPNADFKEESMACDMGQHTLYYYDADTGEMIKCGAYGDVDETPKDLYAKQLWDYYEDKIREAYVPQVNLYTDGDVRMESIHCGYVDGMDGKYVFPNAEDLRAFAARSGIACDGILDDMDEYEMQAFNYLLEIRNVNSTGYDLKADAVMNYNNQTRFLLSPDSVTPDPGDVVGMAMDGFCFVSAYPWIYDISLLGDDWTAAEDIVWNTPDALSGRFTFTNAGTVEYKDYGKTIVLENVVLTDDDGNEYEPVDLVVDYDTAFAPDCETEFFDGYEDGFMPIEWIWKCLRAYDEDGPDSELAMALHGVFEVEVNAGHIDLYYGSYWWD